MNKNLDKIRIKLRHKSHVKHVSIYLTKFTICTYTTTISGSTTSNGGSTMTSTSSPGGGSTTTMGPTTTNQGTTSAGIFENNCLNSTKCSAR